MKQTKRVTVLDASQYCDDEFPEYNWTAPQFAKWVADIVAAIPEEYRDASYFRIDSDTSYDSSRAKIEVGYNRPETDEEERAREAADAARKLTREHEERKQYEALRAKFEGRADQVSGDRNV